MFSRNFVTKPKIDIHWKYIMITFLFVLLAWGIELGADGREACAGNCQ